MLRELGSTDRRAQNGSHRAGAVAMLAPRERPRLLVMHEGDRRLAALEDVLGDLGYRGTVAGTPEEVIAAVLRGPQPDVLLTACSRHSARRSLAFPRECLARWPALRALYICFIPQRLPELLAGRERVLAAPFNERELATALATLWPESVDEA
jgi:CheY-like chemotaxis protein